jgi:uncharacterized protein (TIGR02118 family)
MKTKFKVLFITTGSEKGTWLSEVTHPYWHLLEHGVEIDIATPEGDNVIWDPYSDPATKGSHEADDLVSKGYKTDAVLMAKLNNPFILRDLDLDVYDGVHIPGGLGATFDLFPNEDVAKALEHFWSKGKIVGALCHGIIALANNPARVKGRHVTGYTLVEDKNYEAASGGKVLIPAYPQTVIEEAGAIFEGAEPNGLRVVRDGQLITAQNQFSASDYGLVFYHAMTNDEPVKEYVDNNRDKKMLKVDILIRRNPNLTHEEFVEYWSKSHYKLFQEQPIVQKYVKRYTQSRTVPTLPKGFEHSEYDGIARLWFDDMEAFSAYAASDNYRDILAIDEHKFNDGKPDLLFTWETSVMV